MPSPNTRLIKYQDDLTFDLAISLHGGDKDAARKWLHTPNPYFFNDSPREVVIMGNGIFVIDFLKERLGMVEDE